MHKKNPQISSKNISLLKKYASAISDDSAILDIVGDNKRALEDYKKALEAAKARIKELEYGAARFANKKRKPNPAPVKPSGFGLVIRKAITPENDKPGISPKAESTDLRKAFNIGKLKAPVVDADFEVISSKYSPPPIVNVEKGIPSSSSKPALPVTPATDTAAKGSANKELIKKLLKSNKRWRRGALALGALASAAAIGGTGYHIGKEDAKNVKNSYPYLGSARFNPYYVG